MLLILLISFIYYIILIYLIYFVSWIFIWFISLIFFILISISFNLLFSLFFFLLICLFFLILFFINLLMFTLQALNRLLYFFPLHLFLAILFFFLQILIILLIQILMDILCWRLKKLMLAINSLLFEVNSLQIGWNFIDLSISKESNLQNLFLNTHQLSLNLRLNYIFLNYRWWPSKDKVISSALVTFTLLVAYKAGRQFEVWNDDILYFGD